MAVFENVQILSKNPSDSSMSKGPRASEKEAAELRHLEISSGCLLDTEGKKTSENDSKSHQYSERFFLLKEYLILNEYLNYLLSTIEILARN